MSLSDRVAVITGGSRGIGRAIALGLAAEGAHLAIVYAENHEAANETVKQAGGEAIAIQADVATAVEADRVARISLERYGRIDVLVNVAGRMHVGDFFETSEAEWDEQFAVNAKAIFFLSQTVARFMRTQGSGRIINITSISGLRADPDLVAYSASKAAANMLTKAMAAALGRYNITVNAVLPGTTITDMNRARLEDATLRSRLETATPLRRLGTPEDLVGAVVYLASDAAAWTSGALISVDGGYTA